MRIRTYGALILSFALAAAAPALATSVAPGAKPVLPWIADDYAKALAQARARKVPIFIESWAPW